MPTKSEAAFEELCRTSGLSFERIATASDEGQKRPDYRVTGHDRSLFLAEIKEVAPNAEEAAAMGALLQRQVGAFRTTPGARMREYIAKANAQLRTLAHGVSPGVLVVYNDNAFLRHHTEPYAVLTAMRGLDVVPVHVPKNPRLPLEFQEVRSGPRKQMTPMANTTVAAILTLAEESESILVGRIYHNRHASCPLPLTALAGSRFSHFQMTADERGWQLDGPAV